MTGTPVSRVILTGFMGAGKSTVGALLAESLGWRFVDVDRMLIDQHGVPISQLFLMHGEPGFRVLEAEAVRRTLFLERTVIALGGGALESLATRQILFESPGTHIVFLETPLQVALARCSGDAGAEIRPVLADRAGIEARFNRRLEHYLQAHETIPTSDRSPAELAHDLYGRLVSRLSAKS